MRHIVGGYLDRLSRAPVRKRMYDCSSCLNRAHMRWAWASLFSVAVRRPVRQVVLDGDLDRLENPLRPDDIRA